MSGMSVLINTSQLICGFFDAGLNEAEHTRHCLGTEEGVLCSVFRSLFHHDGYDDDDDDNDTDDDAADDDNSNNQHHHRRY